MIDTILDSMAADNLRDLERKQEQDTANGWKASYQAEVKHSKALRALLTKIETEVAPNRRGHTSRGAAERVLALLMDSQVYMEPERERIT